MTAHAHKTWARSFCSGTNQSDMKNITNIQYQVNGAQLDISGYIRTKCVDGPVLTKLTQLFLKIQAWRNKPDIRQWKLTNTGVYYSIFWSFLWTWILNKPGDNSDTKWKNQICEPNLGHFPNIFYLLGLKIVNLCCVYFYNCVLVYCVTFITVCVDQIQLVYQ